MPAIKYVRSNLFGLPTSGISNIDLASKPYGPKYSLRPVEQGKSLYLNAAPMTLEKLLNLQLKSFVTSCASRIALAFFLLLNLSSVQAADLFLKDLTDSQFEKVIEDFSAVLVHTPLAPASGSTIFGFEVGLVAGVVKTKNLQEVVANVAPGEDLDSLPHAGLFASISIPFGITGELVHLPSYDAEGVKFKNSSLGLKWTLTQTLLDLPVDFALRAHMTNSEFESSQPSTIPGVNVTLNFEDKIMGLQAIVSKSFLIVEPYAGFGVLKANGKLSLAGSTGDSLFDSALSLTDSSDKSITGTQFFVGAYVNLLVFRVAIEAGRVFDTDKVSAKLAFGF